MLSSFALDCNLVYNSNIVQGENRIQLSYAELTGEKKQ